MRHPAIHDAYPMPVPSDSEQRLPHSNRLRTNPGTIPIRCHSCRKCPVHLLVLGRCRWHTRCYFLQTSPLLTNRYYRYTCTPCFGFHHGLHTPTPLREVTSSCHHG